MLVFAPIAPKESAHGHVSINLRANHEWAFSFEIDIDQGISTFFGK